MDEILITLLILGIGFFFMCYTPHISEIFLGGDTYDWASFNTFIKTYRQYEEKCICDSLDLGRIVLSERNQSMLYISLTIIKFHDYYMILYPLSYLIYIFWLLKETFLLSFSRSTRIKGLWKEGDEK